MLPCPTPPYLTLFYPTQPYAALDYGLLSGSIWSGSGVVVWSRVVDEWCQRRVGVRGLERPRQGAGWVGQCGGGIRESEGWRQGVGGLEFKRVREG